MTWPDWFARGRLKRDILALDDFERFAHFHLPVPLFHYVFEGVEDDASKHDNRQVFREFGLIPGTLTNVSQRTARVQLFGRTYEQPFGIAPMGLMGMTAFRGDIAVATAAAHAGIPMVLSGASQARLEEVVDVNPGAWFQAYVPGDEIRIASLVERVARAGVETLVLTVDTRVSSNRENMLRAGFTAPLRPTPALLWNGLTRPFWLWNTFARTLMRHGMPHFENTSATRGAPLLSRRALHDMGPREHLDWSHVRMLRKLWKGNLLLKGVLAVGDARTARENGVDGLIVSNHGGRQLDGAVSPLRVLPAIREVVGALPLIVDGGIRRGTDILKAMALGADAVLVGRPFNYAAALAGIAGVARAIEILAAELRADMGLANLNSLGECGPDLVLRLHGRESYPPDLQC